MMKTIKRVKLCLISELFGNLIKSQQNYEEQTMKSKFLKRALCGATLLRELAAVKR